MSWQQSLAKTLADEVSNGGLPSISMAIRVGDKQVFAHSVGLAQRNPERHVVAEQVYDLASVTKVLAGVGVSAALVDAGRLDLDAPICEVLPDVDRRITTRQLLSHASGYPAWAPLYQRVERWGSDDTRAQVLQLARQTPLEGVPGESHRYSDLGYLTLCALLETIGGQRLDALFHDWVLRRLDLPDLTWGGPPESAATERCPMRGQVIVGQVHDLNTAAMGGVSTHAGLFGTAAAVAHVVDCYRIAAQRPKCAMATFFTHRGAGSHRLGWDGISAGYTSTGQYFPTDTVGHLGYTGTSVWTVPSKETTVTVLTNRIHPVDDLTAIRAARPRIHDAVATALGWDRNSG